MRQQLLWQVSLAALGATLFFAPPAQSAPTREIVFAHEILAQAGPHLDDNVERLVRRIEEVAGFPKGSLRGKAFTRPAEALAYVKDKRAAFAILPAHQLVEGRKPLKLDVLARAVGLDGTSLEFVTVTRKPRPFPEIEGTQGLRVATTEVHDAAWLALLTEGDIDPRRRSFNFVTVASSEEALAAVLAKKADVAILHPMHLRNIKARIEESGDLEWLVTSPKLPPSALVAVGKHASTADRKKLAAAAAKICKTDGAEACGRMGIMYIEPASNDAYRDVIAGYDERAQ